MGAVETVESAAVGAVARARELAAQLSREAPRLEREGVTRADTDRLAAAGLHAVSGPTELGGLDRPGQRAVAELLAGSSPDVWFVWFQHAAVVRLLAASENLPLAERHLAALCAGSTQGGVAFSHLRTGRPSIAAARIKGGWSLSGTQPWCTGWPLIDLVLVGAVAPATDEVVFGLTPAGDRPALHSTGELRLAAMGGTSTHALRLDNVLLGDADVVLRTDYSAWRQRDGDANANVQPSTFGVALAALALLDLPSPATAESLRARVFAVRSQAYALLDEVPPAEAVAERLALRAGALVLGLEAATALLAARGGQGMDLDDPAQLLLRAAAFQLVHAQAPHVRAATLAALAA